MPRLAPGPVGLFTHRYKRVSRPACAPGKSRTEFQKRLKHGRVSGVERRDDSRKIREGMAQRKCVRRNDRGGRGRDYRGGGAGAEHARHACVQGWRSVARAGSSNRPRRRLCSRRTFSAKCGSPVGDAVAIGGGRGVVTGRLQAGVHRPAPTPKSAARLARRHRRRPGDGGSAGGTKTAPPVAVAAPKSAAPAPSAAEAKAAGSPTPRRDEDRVTAWDRFHRRCSRRGCAVLRSVERPGLFSSEVVTDIAKRNNSSYEAFVRRKWTEDELQLNARFDYNETNDIATTDLVKVSGQWRRDFGRCSSCSIARPPSGTGRAASAASPTTTCSCSRSWVRATRCSPRAARCASGCRKPVRHVEQFVDARPQFARLAGVVRGDGNHAAVAHDDLATGVAVPRRGRDRWLGNRFDLNKKLTETLSTSRATRSGAATPRAARRTTRG